MDPKIVPCHVDYGRRDDKYGEFAILQAIARLPGDIKESEADVKDSVQVLTNLMSSNHLFLLDKVCQSEKAAIENRAILLAETKETKAVLAAQIAECCCDMKMQNLELKQFITEKFCDLERRELEGEISSLKQAKVDGTNDGILSTLNAILLKLK